MNTPTSLQLFRVFPAIALFSMNLYAELPPSLKIPDSNVERVQQQLQEDISSLQEQLFVALKRTDSPAFFDSDNPQDPDLWKKVYTDHSSGRKVLSDRSRCPTDKEVEVLKSSYGAEVVTAENGEEVRAKAGTINLIYFPEVKAHRVMVCVYNKAMLAGGGDVPSEIRSPLHLILCR